MAEQPLSRDREGRDDVRSANANRSRRPAHFAQLSRDEASLATAAPRTSNRSMTENGIPATVRLHSLETDGVGASANTMRASRDRRAREVTNQRAERIETQASQSRGTRPQHDASSSLQTRRVRGTERASRNGASATPNAHVGARNGSVAQASTRASAKRRHHDESHFVVRNTHDYDHDDHTAKPIRSHERFDHIPTADGRSALVEDRVLAAHKDPSVNPVRARLRGRWKVALFVITLVLGVASAITTYGMELWGGKSMPYVVGESEAMAEQIIEAKGLKAKVEYTASDDAIGKVVEQHPSTGERVPEGDEVRIFIATSRIVPEVVGLTHEEARKRLNEVGAQSITVVEQPSDQPEGTVLAVSPDQGSAFVSRNSILLTIAGSFYVPDVVGKKEADAIKAIEDAGLQSEVSYISSKQTVRTVVKTSPTAGEAVAQNSVVKVQVSSPYPSNEYHLGEFFSHSSTDLDIFLREKGFAYQGGAIDSTNSAIAEYISYGQGTITFSSQPYKRYLSLPASSEENVLAAGVGISGVRLDTPAEMVPYGADRSDLINIAKTCGLKGAKQFCTNETISLPAGAHAITARFACLSGEYNGLTWTVLRISNGGIVRVAVTCAKTSIYDPADLAICNGSVCQFVAYQEVYLSSEYWVVEKKETKKETKKTTKKTTKTTTKDTTDSSETSDTSDD